MYKKKNLNKAKQKQMAVLNPKVAVERKRKKREHNRELKRKKKMIAKGQIFLK